MNMRYLILKFAEKILMTLVSQRNLCTHIILCWSKS